MSERIGGWVRRVGTDRWVVVGVVLLTRLLYGRAGVVFDASGLEYSSQLLDPVVLQDRTMESIWYLHAQPPAFNLFVGVVLRWSPFAAGPSFHAAYLVLGVALALGVHDLTRLLHVGRRLAVAVTILICCAPATVLYENWLSYEYPVATMLVLLVVAGTRYARDGHTAALLTAVALATLATLTRSLLHPIWLVGAIALLLVCRRPPKPWGVTAAIAAVPLLLVAGLLIKNAVLFDSPQLSSWLGYNASKVALEPLTADQRAQLASEGVLGARVDEPCVPAHPDVPALAEPLKRRPADSADPTAEVPNYNDECLIAKNQRLQRESVAAARAHPRWLARNVVGAGEIWASPSTMTPFVFFNREAIAPVDEAYRRVLLLDVTWDPPVAVPTAWPVAMSAPDRRFHLSLVIVGATAAVIAAAFAAAVTWRRRTPARFAVLLGGATVALVTAAGTMLEFGENNRIRFVAEPLTLVLAVAIVAALIRRVRAWQAARSAPAA